LNLAFRRVPRGLSRPIPFLHHLVAFGDFIDTTGCALPARNHIESMSDYRISDEWPMQCDFSRVVADDL
jgi:hypothetical protein